MITFEGVKFNAPTEGSFETPLHASKAASHSFCPS